MQRVNFAIKDYLEENPQIRKFMKYVTIIAFIIIAVLLVIVAIDVYTWNGFVVRAAKSLVDGLALSMLLFLMVSGFFLIFGLCNVINFAHGAFFMLGGFVGFGIYIGTEAAFLDPALPFHLIFGANHFALSVIAFILSAIGATAVLALIGGGIEFFTIRRLYGNPIGQILLTVGFMFIISQMAEMFFAPPQITFDIIQWSQISYFFISGILDFGGGLQFDLYRLFLIFVGFVVAGLMFVGFKKTRIGLQIQAGIFESII
ncbi:MAG: hypothetical protein ACFFCP_15250 [Promethearchaeota archaeon]